MKNDGQKSTIYIVRHGETNYNVNGIIQGQTDSPLTLKGIRQAKQLAKVFEKVQFDIAFSSDLPRAFKTAEIIISSRKVNIMKSKYLRERNYGEYDGKHFSFYVEKRKNFLNKLKGLNQIEKRKLKLADDIESDEEVSSRFIKILNKLIKKHTNKTILIATHGGIMRSFLNHLNWNGKEDLKSGAIKNTGYIKLYIEDTNYFVEEVVGVEK